jgi:hypothetical protein
MATTGTIRTFVCLLVLAVTAVPFGPSPLASEAISNPSIESTDEGDFAEGSTPSSPSSGSGEEAVCGTIEEPIEDADTGPVCHGIVTCTFYVAGQAIALPFRLLGGALEIII